MPNRTDPIVVVGAGTFGLSTALHLAHRGYTSITLFDKQPHHDTHYSYAQGSDGASADVNKIFRCAYGAQTEYMRLSIEAKAAWEGWNADLRSGEGVSARMGKGERVFVNCGNLSLAEEEEGKGLPEFEMMTVTNMEEEGYTDTQLITTDPTHAEVARRRGFGFAMDPFRRASRGRSYLGVLDTTGGMTLADKVCRFALHKAQKLGVRTVFGPETGKFADFTRGSDGLIDGIRTHDGRQHPAAQVIMACGGWTPSLVPSLDSVCETTCGSVVLFRIPKTSPLFSRYSAANFPTWTWNVRAGAEGGLYGFPVTEDGLLKIGYRGEKYANPRPQDDGQERSVPITRYTESEQITSIPHKAWRVIRRFLEDWMPDLLEDDEVTVETTRLCWYTDSWDNHFVIDWVPGHEGRVMVATAGSGHAFKYTPIIGHYVVDILESKGLKRELVRKWRWRSQPSHHAESPAAPVRINQLMEGAAGNRVLSKQRMVEQQDMQLNSRSKL